MKEDAYRSYLLISLSTQQLVVLDWFKIHQESSSSATGLSVSGSCCQEDHEDISIWWFKIGLGKFIDKEIYKQILNGIGQNVTSSILT